MKSPAVDFYSEMGEMVTMMLLLRRRKKALEQKRKRQRRFWVHPMISQRLSIGHFPLLFRELRKNPEKFFSYTRMSVATFDSLLVVLRPRLMRITTNMRKSITPEERLIVTLRYLATGESFASLRVLFLMGTTTIGKILKETCQAIWEELKSSIMPEPTQQQWLENVDLFWQSTQFPNCIGALDGRLIRILMPPMSESRTYNYKRHFSMVLAAIVDNNYNFVTIDVFGSSADLKPFRSSPMGQKLAEGIFNIPSRQPLPGRTQPAVPFVLAASEAFGLSENHLCPYAHRGLTKKKKVFCYRLGKARRVAACAFNILSNKWRVLKSTMQLNVDTAGTVVQACCILHNYVHQKEGHTDEEVATENLLPVAFKPVRAPLYVHRIRDMFADYFISSSGENPGQHSVDVVGC
ncbi:uncharacterized protein [Hyperolius riggenbachi]|uniref:uncharacterized protein isoform X1 n=1 Tax=Hyperolius riggenbachi TaxID=752182 RepID=UPI0035A2DCF0